jgi:hypothetical protein
MKIVNLIIATLILCLGCSSQNDNGKQTQKPLLSQPTLDTLTLQSKTSFNFKYDLDDPNGFGFQSFEHDLPVGPQDVKLTYNSIYVLDRYHSNIKKIDMNGKVQLASDPLSDENIWLKQIEILDDRILVTSELDSIYIYSENLELMERKFLQKGNPRIFQTNSSRIVLYYPMNGHEFLELNEQGDITNRVMGIKHKSDYKSDISYTNFSVSTKNKVFITDPVHMRELIHSINDRTIATLMVSNDQLSIELFDF